MDYVKVKQMKTKAFGTLYNVELKDKRVLSLGKVKANKLAKEIDNFINKRRAFYQKGK